MIYIRKHNGIDEAKEFPTKEELFAYIRENKALLKLEKKSALKISDSFSFTMPSFSKEANKEADEMPTTDIEVVSIINACNMFDSHGDVHIAGIWNKSVKETKLLYLLDGHVMKFDHIISDQVKASVENRTWKELGYKYAGETQCLVFTSSISAKRNKIMYDHYKNGWVRNHSVGMRYVTYHLCMNSESKFDVEEKANWDKYYPVVVNQKDVDEYGYFWAVTEAKFIEGSAVVMGSCPATPTISVSESEPKEVTQAIQPPKGTEKKSGWELFKY